MAILTRCVPPCPILPDPTTAWGDAHDAFKKAAKDISSSAAPCLVAGVPISNSKDYPVNTQLAVSAYLNEQSVCVYTFTCSMFYSWR
jgi:hypothetical protein